MGQLGKTNMKNLEIEAKRIGALKILLAGGLIVIIKRGLR